MKTARAAIAPRASTAPPWPPPPRPKEAPLSRSRRKDAPEPPEENQRLPLHWALVLGVAGCAALAAFVASGPVVCAVTAVTVAGGLHLIIE